MDRHGQNEKRETTRIRNSNILRIFVTFKLRRRKKETCKNIAFKQKINKQTNERKQKCNETSNRLFQIKSESRNRVLRY